MKYLVKVGLILFLSGFGLAGQVYGSLTAHVFNAGDKDEVFIAGTCISGAALQKSGEIKKEICSIDNSAALKETVQKEVLEGEISGVSTFYLEVPEGQSYVYKPVKGSVSVFLVTHGTGSISQGSSQFDVSNVNLFVPSVHETASVKAGRGSLGVLEIRIMLNADEFKSVSQETGKLPYFVDYTKCAEYKEAIKSPKTTSRTIIPENIIPRFCLGSVETSGPDEVGAHAHPMLEQLFFGLPANDCTVKADEAVTEFSENMLLHIPLGSTHGVKVEDGKHLYYIWMDLFRSQKDMSYIKENHITNDK
jgi:hypothetical protein